MRHTKTPLAALALSMAFVSALGCGPKQVCECAVHVGGTTPASGDEASARSSAVERCLERHGGGTISGCPMPPSAAPDFEADEITAANANDEPAHMPAADVQSADEEEALLESTDEERASALEPIAPETEDPWPTLVRAPTTRAPGHNDLSGTWLETTAAHARGPHTHRMTCAGTVPEHWSFEQRAAHVQAEHRATSNYASGIRGRFFVPAY